MKCPFCGTEDTRVVNSRVTQDGAVIRRRRECSKCLGRFTTREHVEGMEFQVVKRDQRREPFNRDKILRGLAKAFEKRPFGVSTWEGIADLVEHALQRRPDREITTVEIGKMIMDQLQSVDEVAYIRFASVYRQFRDLSQFEEELELLKSQGKPQSQA